ncbi:hypothetical protein GDO81_009074 [Engystomops pustulosus]|uniref:Uncharacterized protein n=1 Tax=Engystomops pustulosus TaxID=76066 RepID=A0AAV7BNC2_ENGPU|nr:hypothetical protein GDO81_009074 [Engystomops pustulosus]
MSQSISEVTEGQSITTPGDNKITIVEIPDEVQVLRLFPESADHCIVCREQSTGMQRKPPPAERCISAKSSFTR